MVCFRCWSRLNKQYNNYYELQIINGEALQMGNYMITGANSEIGNALAHHLNKKGHKLLLISRSTKNDFSLNMQD